MLGAGLKKSARENLMKTSLTFSKSRMAGWKVHNARSNCSTTSKLMTLSNANGSSLKEFICAIPTASETFFCIFGFRSKQSKSCNSEGGLERVISFPSRDSPDFLNFAERQSVQNAKNCHSYSTFPSRAAISLVRKREKVAVVSEAAHLEGGPSLLTVIFALDAQNRIFPTSKETIGVPTSLFKEEFGKVKLVCKFLTNFWGTFKLLLYVWHEAMSIC